MHSQVAHVAHQILQEFRPVPAACTNVEVIYKWSFGQATEHRGCDPGTGLAHVPGSIFLACPPGRVFAAPSSGWPHWRQVASSHAKGGGKTATSVRSTSDKRPLGYPFNRSWRFASTGGSAKVAPSWVDGRDASAVWGEPPLGYGSL